MHHAVVLYTANVSRGGKAKGKQIRYQMIMNTEDRTDEKDYRYLSHLWI